MTTLCRFNSDHFAVTLKLLATLEPILMPNHYPKHKYLSASFNNNDIIACTYHHWKAYSSIPIPDAEMCIKYILRLILAATFVLSDISAKFSLREIATYSSINMLITTVQHMVF